MQRSELREKLNEIFKLTVKGDVDVEKIDENCNLVTDLGLNSVGVLYVVIAIEEFFSIQFDDVGFGDFKTGGDVLDYIEGKLSE